MVSTPYYAKPITITQLAHELQSRAKKVGFDPRRDMCPLHVIQHIGDRRIKPIRFRMDCTHSLQEVIEHLEALEKEQSDG